MGMNGKDRNDSKNVRETGTMQGVEMEAESMVGSYAEGKQNDIIGRK